jgi:ribA/ribD-fused uncharacterized protein
MIAHFKSEEHKFLSNFYPAEVIYLGVKYPSSEHAYMSAKSDEELIIDGKTYKWKYYCTLPTVKPGKIKGESRYLTLPSNWDEIKVQIMYECLISKFSNIANLKLREKLLATGNQNIQEGNWHGDQFWGVDLRNAPNIGENNLGRLLMRIRDEIIGGHHKIT